MGLFSFSNKNKQETVAEDSGYYSRADEDSASAARAKSKRASNAGEPAARRSKQDKAAAADPVLPEKKRARRRLVGAVALALAVAVGLPMLLDSEPKPLASDIAIQIPSKDKALGQPLPVPMPAAAALDQREEIVEPPKPAVPAAAVPAAAAPAPAAAPAAALGAPGAREVAQVKLDAPKADPRAVAKPEPKKADKLAEKGADKLADKVADKAADKVAVKPPVEAKPAKAGVDAPHDAARALAILEGMSPAAEAAPAPKFLVQVASLASQEKVTELQGKLKGAGIASFTQKVPTQSGELTRVSIGPLSKDEAEKMRAKLARIGLAGRTVPG